MNGKLLELIVQRCESEPKPLPYLNIGTDILVTWHYFAKTARKGRSTIHRWIDDYAIPFVEVGGAHWFSTFDWGDAIVKQKVEG